MFYIKLGVIGRFDIKLYEILFLCYYFGIFVVVILVKV